MKSYTRDEILHPGELFDLVDKDISEGTVGTVNGSPTYYVLGFRNCLMEVAELTPDSSARRYVPSSEIPLPGAFTKWKTRPFRSSDNESTDAMIQKLADNLTDLRFAEKIRSNFIGSGVYFRDLPGNVSFSCKLNLPAGLFSTVRYLVKPGRVSPELCTFDLAAIGAIPERDVVRDENGYIQSYGTYGIVDVESLGHGAIDRIEKTAKDAGVFLSARAINTGSIFSADPRALVHMKGFVLDSTGSGKVFPNLQSAHDAVMELHSASMPNSIRQCIQKNAPGSSEA